MNLKSVKIIAVWIDRSGNGREVPYYHAIFSGK